MAKDTVFSSKKTLNINGRIIDLTTPIVMGILNVTPDSFHDSGQHTNAKSILAHVEKMLSDGASIIDIGGYSSRPGANEVSVEEETRRVIEAVSIVKKEFPKAIISVDTFRSSVADKTINEGATIINDISGGELDSDMFATVAKLKIPYIMMHMRGTPASMQQLTDYNNLITDIVDFFVPKIITLREMGISDIIIDPGFGFAKTTVQNFELLQKLQYFQGLGLPLLAGISRKSMIYNTLHTTAEMALNGTSVLNTIALMNGAQILRVHDVKEAMECISLYKATYS